MPEPKLLARIPPPKKGGPAVGPPASVPSRNPLPTSPFLGLLATSDRALEGLRDGLKKRRFAVHARNFRLSIVALLLCMAVLVVAAQDLVKEQREYDAAKARCLVDNTVGGRLDASRAANCVTRAYVAYVGDVSGTNLDRVETALQQGQAVVPDGALVTAEEAEPVTTNTKILLYWSGIGALFCVLLLAVSAYSARADRRVREPMQRRIEALDQFCAEGTVTGKEHEELRDQLHKVALGWGRGTTRLRIARTIRVIYAIGFPLAILGMLTLQGGATPALGATLDGLPAPDPKDPLPAVMLPIALPIVGSPALPQPDPVGDVMDLVPRQAASLNQTIQGATRILDAHRIGLGEKAFGAALVCLFLAAFGEAVGLLGRFARSVERERLDDRWVALVRRRRLHPGPPEV